MGADTKTVDVLAVLALVQAASPGPWEADTETNDAGFRSYVMTDGSNCRLFDSLNADACVATEGDEDGVYHWDVTAERNFKAAAAAVEFVRLNGAAIAELIERDRIHSMELNRCRNQYMHAIKVLSAIEMRCAPDDVTLPDGQVMRFIPPEPELYWRELSAKVKAVKDEVRALLAADDVAALRACGGAPSYPTPSPSVGNAASVEGGA